MRVTWFAATTRACRNTVYVAIRSVVCGWRIGTARCCSSSRARPGRHEPRFQFGTRNRAGRGDGRARRRGAARLQRAARALDDAWVIRGVFAWDAVKRAATRPFAR